MQWFVRLQPGASPWLPQRFIPKEALVDMVAWCVNTEGGANYSLRLRALARLLHERWSWSIGVIGMQQVMADMSDCPFPSTHDNGASCFARLLEREYVDLSNKAVAESALGMYKNRLPPHARRGHPSGFVLIPTGKGVVAGWPWRILNTFSWRIGQDKMWEDRFPLVDAGSVRYLQEAELVHMMKGWKVRFYNTHTSHNTGDGSREVDNSDERQSQIERIREIVGRRVTPGELPPIVVGDFNCRQDAPENTMSHDYDFVHDDGDKEHIWIGRHSAFPETTGRYTKLWTETIPSSSPIVVDGVDLDSLTDGHNSPGAGFKIET